MQNCTACGLYLLIWVEKESFKPNLLLGFSSPLMSEALVQVT